MAGGARSNGPSDGIRSKKTNEGTIDPQILAAIKATMQPMIDAQTAAISEKLDVALSELTAVRGKVDALETAVQHTSDRVDTVAAGALPSITNHIAKISKALAMRQLETEVHRRKWSLVINGVAGAANETEEDTRAAILGFGQETLQIPDADTTRISACHLLGQDADSGIYLRFTDLHERNKWLSQAKHLKGNQSKISMSPDLPPVLRKLKKDILSQRRELDENIKKKSRIHYLKLWPFVMLKIKDHPDRSPRISQDEIVKDVLGIRPLIQLQDM